MRDCCVEYKRFCDTVEEAFTQLHLDRAPLLEPVQHVVCSDGDHNFLNYEERQIVSLAMQKLAGQHTEGLREVLKVSTCIYYYQNITALFFVAILMNHLINLI